MMASLDLGLAWSVEVPVAKFGAHLQAYVELQPTINTLRLCNRYGQGPKAAIAKLPAELVSAIEGYLVDDERKKQRKNWKTDFKCFQGLCKPIDHLSNSEQVDIFYDISENLAYDAVYGASSEEDECVCIACNVPNKLSARRRRILEDFLGEQIEDDGEEGSCWWLEHENRSARWEGKAGSSDGSLLSRYSATLLSNFGLQLWATHVQTNRTKDGQFTIVGINTSTIAYLTLPRVMKSTSMERAYSEAREFNANTPYLCTQSGGGFVVPAPPVMSEAHLMRFTRALKILGLSQSESRREAKAEDKGTTKASDTSELKKDTVEPKAERDMAPKLRILFRNSFDDEY